MNDNTLNYKATMDRLLNDLRKACHTMIDQGYVSESPIKLVREALDYLDQKHLEKLNAEK